MSHTNPEASSQFPLTAAHTSWLNGLVCADAALKNPVSVRANSHIFRAAVQGPTPLEAAVKQCLHPQTGQPDPLAARTQFSALKRVNQAFTNPSNRFRVPAPYTIAPELGIFSMAWVEGKSLSEQLRHANALVNGTQWMHDVGAWLGYFHKAGPLKAESLETDQRRLRVAPTLLLAQVGAAPLQAAHTLRHTVNRLRQEQVAVTWLHGDCKADNFILSGSHIYGIDISLCHENPVEYDLAMFFNNWDLLLCSPGLVPLWPLKNRFEKAFWAGYRCNGPSVSTRYLAWVRLRFLLAPWQTLLSTNPSAANHWLMKKIYSRMATRLSAQILGHHVTPASL